MKQIGHRWWALSVAITWLLVYLGLARYFVLVLPRAVTAVVSLSLYLWLVQIMAALLGVLLVIWVDRTVPGLKGRLLPWSTAFSPHLPTRPGLRKKMVLALALGPGLYILAHSLGMAIAYRTLIAELAAQGAQAVQQKTGALGRAAAGDQLWSLLPFTVIVAPLAEELLFRGAWYGAFESWFGGSERVVSNQAKPASAASVPASIPGLKRKHQGGGLGLLRFVPWLASSMVFGFMHADTSGGMGLMRTASSSVLGLACGYLRYRTGSLAAPILMHASFNLISLSTLRGWLVFDGFPTRYALPTSLFVIAPIALVLGWGVTVLIRSVDVR